MTLSHKLRHWFTPHTTNNFRARLLHNSGILVLVGIIFASNVAIRLLDNPSLNILGFTSTVSIDEVVHQTNEARVSQGLKPLTYNEKLADAARRKANDMLTNNYWAHTSPSGKTPWTWFQAAGYNYLFAGENLAKDFGDTGKMMAAWMASPTHKENIVSPKYSEIGIAVVPGSLQGSDTVLVVQLFGARGEGIVPQVASAQTQKVVEPVAEAVAEPIKIAEVSEVKIEEDLAPTGRINGFNLAKALNLSTTLLFILALILDLYLAQSLKLSRRVGNNWAHILFINFILLATTIVNAGKIM